jgi:GABA(A) receptor-associated protein
MAEAERKSFKEENSFDKRCRLAQKIRQAHPDRVPIIVEKHPRSKSVPDIAKRKFLAPNDITIAQFISEIRKHITVSPDTGIFLFVNGNVLPSSGALMQTVYANHKDEDGFLYIVYSGESIMGSTI